MVPYCATPGLSVRTSCLINHYNYGEYVFEACDSALAQTHPFDEIVLVDDGSADGSLERLRRRYGGQERVRLLAKANEGQLSCFNAGFAASTGDVVFFLDSDDVYEPDYVAAVLDVYARRPDVDFVFAARRTFGRVEGVESSGTGDRDLGYSVVSTLARRKWIGACTSCLSMRRRLLERILPIPYLEDWRVRADDCLVFGASVVGGRKYYLDRALVRYRVHDRNAYYGRDHDAVHDYRRKLAIHRLFVLLETRMGYDMGRLSDFAHSEFRTIERPTASELRDYVRIALRRRAPWSRRAGSVGSMLGYYLRAGAGPRRLAAPVRLARRIVGSDARRGSGATSEPRPLQPSKRS